MKRRRIERATTFRGLPKRPINKSLITIYKTISDATQVNTTLATITYPGTITGLRWDLSVFQSDTAASDCRAIWAIVVCREGQSASTLALGDAATTYSPEDQLLTFGTVGIGYETAQYQNPQYYSGSTKTMRKLQGGDTVLFIMKTSGADADLNVMGVIQFFIKT